LEKLWPNRPVPFSKPSSTTVNEDARRSLGEAELRRLKDQPILMPHDEAFLPAKEALAWRLERLAA